MHNIMQVLVERGYLVLFVAVLAEQFGLPVPAPPLSSCSGSARSPRSRSLAPLRSIHLLALRARSILVSKFDNSPIARFVFGGDRNSFGRDGEWQFVAQRDFIQR